MISVIIPIYNVEKFVVDCLQSVIRQTYTDIEVLLVDDCGTDRSMDMVRDFCSAYHGPIDFRILTHNQNKGLSAARNTGLDHAKGEAVYFLDSDDEISDQCLEELYKALHLEDHVDFSIGNYKTIPYKEIFDPLRLGNGIYSADILSLYANRLIFPMAVNKLYCTRFIKEHRLRFKENMIHEDLPWSFCTCFLAKKIAVTTDVTYYYKIQSNSIQTGTDEAKHYHHYCLATLEKIPFVLSQKAQKEHSFNIINKEILHLYREPLYRGNTNYPKHLYSLLRSYPYWSFKEIWQYTHDTKRLILHLHRFLPTKIGFMLFQKMIGRYYDR